MYNPYRTYPCPYYTNTPIYNPNSMYDQYNSYQCPYFANTPMYASDCWRESNNSNIPFDDKLEDDLRLDYPWSSNRNSLIELKDYGPQPFVVDINEATKQNTNFRTALWTGNYFQITLMSIPVGDDIGLEMHPAVDQFLRVEEGRGLVRMGKNKNNLDFEARVSDDFAIIIPSGTWHNVINTGNTPLKVYSIYAPPQHPHGTVHITKKDAEAAEAAHRNK